MHHPLGFKQHPLEDAGRRFRLKMLVNKTCSHTPKASTAHEGTPSLFGMLILQVRAVSF